jgi:hypothetical protein
MSIEFPVLAHTVASPDVPRLSAVSPQRRRTVKRECRICLGEHDEAVHDATRNVRDWFREEVTKNLE